MVRALKGQVLIVFVLGDLAPGCLLARAGFVLACITTSYLMQFYSTGKTVKGGLDAERRYLIQLIMFLHPAYVLRTFVWQSRV
jgi:hypothetical protein